jgi:hypothetical protein
MLKTQQVYEMRPNKYRNWDFMGTRTTPCRYLKKDFLFIP